MRYQICYTLSLACAQELGPVYQDYSAVVSGGGVQANTEMGQLNLSEQNVPENRPPSQDPEPNIVASMNPGETSDHGKPAQPATTSTSHTTTSSHTHGTTIYHKEPTYVEHRVVSGAITGELLQLAANQEELPDLGGLVGSPGLTAGVVEHSIHTDTAVREPGVPTGVVGQPGIESVVVGEPGIPPGPTGEPGLVGCDSPPQFNPGAPAAAPVEPQNFQAAEPTDQHPAPGTAQTPLGGVPIVSPQGRGGSNTGSGHPQGQGSPKVFPQVFPQAFPQLPQGQGFPQGFPQIPQGQGFPQGFPQFSQGQRFPQGFPQIPQGHGSPQGFPQGIPQGIPQGVPPGAGGLGGGFPHQGGLGQGIDPQDMIPGAVGGPQVQKIDQDTELFSNLLPAHAPLEHAVDHNEHTSHSLVSSSTTAVSSSILKADMYLKQPQEAIDNRISPNLLYSTEEPTMGQLDYQLEGNGYLTFNAVQENWYVSTNGTDTAALGPSNSGSQTVAATLWMVLLNML